MPQYHTFIVRIWTDDVDGLHGQITHLSTQERCDFRDLKRMVDCIVDHLGKTAGTRNTTDTDIQDRGSA